MTNFTHGRLAEETAATYLESHGFTILGRNWRTKYCEIDIVASRESIVFFVEVKYRRTRDQGDGLDYITTKKRQRMLFAASIWIHAHRWTGDSRLCALEVSGHNYQVGEFIDEL